MSISSFFQFLLCIIFATAGIAKLIGSGSFQTTLKKLGMPLLLRNSFVIIVPILELVSSICLIVQPLLVIGNIIVMLLLAGFVWASFISISNKRKISCNCFGTLTRGRLGWSTLAQTLIIFLFNLYIILSTDTLQISEIISYDTALAVMTSIEMLLIYALLTLLAAYRKHLSSSS